MLELKAIGNIGKDAEIKQVGDRKVISFNVAIDQSYKNKDEVKVEQTEWVNCSIWKGKDQSTEIAKYLKKGKKVYISGVPSSDAYTPKVQESEELKIQSVLCLKVNQLELLSKKDN